MSDQSMPSKGQLLEQQSAEERIAFAAYKQTYMARVPLPQKPSSLDLKGLGFAFWLYFTQAITSIALAAMRTSDAFYFVGYATVGNGFYAGTEAILSVLAVEVGMVVFAAILAQKRYKRQEAELRARAEQTGARFRSSKEVDLNAAVIWAGLILMALISMAAGLHQSVKIIENVSPEFVKYLSYGLGITIGVGITVIAVIAGDILGQQLAIVTAGFADRAADYEEEMAAYQQELEDAWARSDERRYIRADVRAAAKQQSSAFGYDRTERTNTERDMPRKPAKWTERIYAYLDESLARGHLPQVKEISDNLEVAKSTASEIRTRYLAERGINPNDYVVVGSNGHGTED